MASQASTTTESRRSLSSRTTCSAGPAAARTGRTDEGQLQRWHFTFPKVSLAHLSISLLLFLALLSLSRIGMSPAPRDSLVVTSLASGPTKHGITRSAPLSRLARPLQCEQSTDHAVDSCARLCEHEFLNFLAAVSTREACRVVRLVSCRRGFRPGQTLAIRPILLRAS